jgi:hypothetical protein
MCGSSNLEFVFGLAPSPIGDSFVSVEQVDKLQPTYPIDLFLCRGCGLVQLLDVFPWKVLHGEPRYHKPGWVRLDKHIRGYVDEVLALLTPSCGSLIIDIGSDEGVLLRCFQEQGMRPLGIEPASEIARKATAKGIETLSEFLTPELACQIKEERGPAAVVMANNVFANIDDLVSATKSVRDLLAPDGVFIFESIYLADLIQNTGFDFFYHEHLSTFAVGPICSFFQCIGMELFDVRRLPAKGGSVRCFVQLEGAARSIKPSVKRLVASENKLGLFLPETYSHFSSRVDVLKAQVFDLLSDLRSKGNSIVGFGASITGTTLIYHFGIGELLDYLVDDNPAKKGLFSPGLHLPVFPSGELYERKPDYVVVLAWRFVEPIVMKNAAFLEQGGHFIVPVPEVRII